MNVKPYRVLGASLLLCVTLGMPQVASADASRASANSSAGLSLVSASVVAGSVIALGASGAWAVEGVSRVGNAVVVSLKAVGEKASEVGKVSVKVSEAGLGGASLAVGTVITVVAESSGHALYLSGRLIAFIPNEVGKSMMHHSAVKATEQPQ